jgi:myosin-crossreactive antigen
MIQVNVIFKNAFSREKIQEFVGMNEYQATLLTPSDGFVRLHEIDYEVDQVVKEIDTSKADKGVVFVTVHVFIRTVANNDRYIL